MNSYVDRLSAHDIGQPCGYATRTTTTPGPRVIRDAVFSFRDVPVPAALQAYAMIQKPEAARRALEHYRSALAIDSTSARAGGLWREAYRFAALEVPPQGWMATEMC